jgi:hypothetical protein
VLDPGSLAPSSVDLGLASLQSCPIHRSSYPINQLLRLEGFRQAYHAQSHSLVPRNDIREDLGCGSHTDPLLVSELVQSTVHTEICLPVSSAGGSLMGREARSLPVLTISGTSSHGTEKIRVDLNDLLHRSGSFIVS